MPTVVLATMMPVACEGPPLAGRYRLAEPVASGATGQVWRAVDLVLERQVAVKLLRPDVAGDPEARARFRAEARHASRLSHPGVAQVYDYGEDGYPELPFLVMELVHGPSLAGLLAAGPLDPCRTMDLIAQVSEGLHAAHSAGLVHRDIKPANLLITADGQVKITDFGLASVARDASLTVTGALVGTAAYLAPERAAGASATPASDLYSLGVVGYECLTGGPPFRGPALQVAEAHLLRPFPALPESVPAEVAALVAALTAKNPGNRPASAREVAERAGQLRAGKITVLAATAPATANGGSAAGSFRTLADIGAQATQPGRPFPGQRPAAPHLRSRWKLAGAGLAGLAAMTAAGLAGWQAGLAGAAQPHTAAAPRAAAAPPVRMVLVNSATLAGQPVGAVLAGLHMLGLHARLRWVPASARPGTVLSVRPGGTLPPGTIVTVTVAARPAGQGGQPAGDGDDGGGGNDGGGDDGGNGGH